MANAIKRMNKVDNTAFQKRCEYYMYQKAAAIFAASSPDADDLLLAKALWANQVQVKDMVRIVVTNTTIGAAIDAGTDVAESDIEYVIITDTAFHNLALSYKAAGLIGA